MGKFDFQMDPELVAELQKLADYDGIAKGMLQACEPDVIAAVKAECQNHVETAAMVNSVKSTGIKKNQYGYYAIVRPTGTGKLFKRDKKSRRRIPLRNMEKLAWLEYGYTKQSGKKIAPKAILTKAVNEVYPKCMKKMQEEYDRKAGK